MTRTENKKKKYGTFNMKRMVGCDQLNLQKQKLILPLTYPSIWL